MKIPSLKYRQTLAPEPRTLRLVAAMLLAACALVSSARGAEAPDLNGWRLVWRDEFEAPTVSTAEWDILNRRDSFNNELQYYRPEQASIVNGALRITATNQPLSTKSYRSARLESRDAFAYGRFEARIDLPTTQGMWPAFWLFPISVPWPTAGEIDIMENRGSQPNLVSSAYHFQRAPGPCCGQHEYVFEEFTKTVAGQPVNFHSGYHTYAVEWEPGTLRFYVNDEIHWQLLESVHNVPIFSTAMNIIINLAVGGNFGGNPNGTTIFPQHMDVDYVRVWQRPVAGVVVGDYNGNGEVDAADYSVWRDSVGQEGIGLAADGSGNGVVGQSDYDTWQIAYSSTQQQVHAVPEPGSAAVTILAAATLASLRSVRRRRGVCRPHCNH